MWLEARSAKPEARSYFPNLTSDFCNFLIAPITRIPHRNPVFLTYNDPIVKAYVYVSLKRTVLDPQGKTIQGALNKMGYKGLEDIRQGKYFEITLDGGLTKEDANAEVERIAREVLTNPVIEEFRFSLEG